MDEQQHLKQMLGSWPLSFVSCHLVSVSDIRWTRQVGIRTPVAVVCAIRSSVDSQRPIKAIVFIHANESCSDLIILYSEVQFIELSVNCNATISSVEANCWRVGALTVHTIISGTHAGAVEGSDFSPLSVQCQFDSLWQCIQPSCCLPRGRSPSITPTASLSSLVCESCFILQMWPNSFNSIPASA